MAHFIFICFVAKNLEVHRADHDLLDNGTFGLKAVNDVQTVWVNTACKNDHRKKNLYQK